MGKPISTLHVMIAALAVLLLTVCGNVFAAQSTADAVADVVTISAGVACQVPDGESTPEALLAQADAHLYRAKQAGRNRADDGTDVLS